MFKKAIPIILAFILVFSLGCQQQAPPASPEKPPTAGEPTGDKPAIETPATEKPAVETPSKEISAEDIRVAKELVEEAKKLRYDKKYKEATLKCEEALAKNPKGTEIFEEMAAVYKGQNDYSKAVEIYVKALDMDPKNSQLLVSKAGTLRMQSKFDEALEDYNKVLELKPDEKSVYMEIAYTYRDKKDYENAEKAYEKAIEKFPDDFNLAGNYAAYWSYRGFGESDKAKSAEYFQKSADFYDVSFKKMTDKDEFSKPGNLYSAGDAYYQKWKKSGSDEDKKKALEKFEAYKKQKPDHVWMETANKKMDELKK